jgi:hypothetical protein
VSLKARNEALFARFATVKTVGDAWNVAIEALRESLAVAQKLGESTGPEIVSAMRMLQDARKNVDINLEPFRTPDNDAPLPLASWKHLKAAIGGLYATWWAIEDVLPESERHTAWEAWGSMVLDIGAAVPDAAKATIDFAGDLGGKAVGAAADAASNVLWKFVKGAWPILLAAGVVLTAGVYLAASGVAVPKVKVST